MKKHLSFAALFCLVAVFHPTQGHAQIQYDTIQWWNLAVYNQVTLDRLAADTENWEYNSKGRYMNRFTTDGTLLKAQGSIIAETDGLYIGAGIEAGSLLLRHAMGASQNGLQMQRNKPVTIRNLKKGQTVVIDIKSSSSSQQGIATVSNLEGKTGSDTYTTSAFKTYTFKVIADGDVSWTNSGGVVVKSVGVLEELGGETVETPVIEADGKLITITCPTPDAEIWYSLVDHGDLWNYARKYESPFEIDRTCRIRAGAVKEGYKVSETAEKTVTVPLVLPFSGRPFVLDPEPLDRGAIATFTRAASNWLISWRWLIDDPSDISFNVYRDGTLLNSTPITGKTNHMDISGSESAVYVVESLSQGTVIGRDTALMLPKGYLDIPLERPAGGSTESGDYIYVPGDCMVADADGDGQYEVFMKWDPFNKDGNVDAVDAGQKDNSIGGYTGNVLIDAYTLEGTRLWRIDLGKNIRAGAHYTQLMVYDLDGDGRAEVACKTAPGTIDGKGRYVLLDDDDPTADYRSVKSGKAGVIVDGPEYLSVFSGLSGENLATVPYRPSRDTIGDWGDSYGNRSERYLACVAYLDGQRPSLVMCRGYYTSTFLWAVDFDRDPSTGEGRLSTRWLHSSTQGGYGAFGEGAHGISVADIDGDLRDEIIYGACAIDDDGQLIYRTGFGHGDALHVGDFNPDVDGLEVMMVHEETSAPYGIEMHEALTGKVIAGVYAGSDVGRGLCADIDASNRGCEYWGYDYNVYNASGKLISTKRPSTNFRTYWDADIQEEMTERGAITKWQGTDKDAKTLIDFTATFKAGTDLIKYTPCLQADIFGDWREEQIYYDNATRSHLWIFSTPYYTNYRVPCLMQDHQYRMATVWQTSAYNQPPHLSYYLPDYIQYLSGIESIRDEAGHGEVLSEKFYDLMGRPLYKSDGFEGICLRVKVYSDGYRCTEKISSK